ncbi:hypothetical protein Fmac_016623 [Flemingia macrophylla]|uniref:Protein kinase domain-containing protein n=1 Tax=Flemingia macrophylla TaxID=520843 RepID=A0ABD1MHY5_9FABA
MRFNSITSLTLLLVFNLSTHLEAYTPQDKFTISCGTIGKSFDGERTWMGDSDTTYLSTQEGTVSAKPTTQSPSINQVPYNTARLSRSQFNYTFPVTTGPKFVRLFFYPTSYPSFPRTHASFSVQSDQFTLHLFNASINIDAENTETIFKEYVVHLYGAGRLNLIFTPSRQNSYAFVNGIEVLSVPIELYNMSPNPVGIPFVGRPSNVIISYMLETEYRINVGGQEISAPNDSGLFRKWAADEEDYLIKQSSTELNGKINITVDPDYMAPKQVYKTARTKATLNNLTWEFSVDSNFIYMVRLHFCELDPNINNIGERVFSIFLASELAEEQADVLRWSQKHKGLAVQRDYAVLLPHNDTQKKVNLSIQMQSYESANDNKKYSHPFLSGLEIFKIPEYDREPQPQSSSSIVVKSRWSIIDFLAAVASSACVVLTPFAIIYVYRRASGQLSFSATKSTNSWKPSVPCRRFSITEIKAATDNFDEAFIVGVGGFGHVYKGYIGRGDDPTTVAIKRLKQDSQQGPREFKNEIEMLAQLRHLHLVSLIGYCNDDDEMILVYDFMTRGNLRRHLYDTDNPPLSWKQRLHICIGAARGLQFLHTGAKHVIIHHDVKTTNILLDEKWVAKVSDLGLSSIGPTDISNAHINTVVKGSFGYLDPEYCIRNRLTEKSDVYSFGVVLFEIVCARPPLIHTTEMQQVSLANWVRHCHKSGILTQIVDPTLKGRIAPECFNKFCEIGVSCLLEDGTQRPSMSEVVSELEFALQLQESVEQCQSDGMVTDGVHEKGEDNRKHAFKRGNHGYCELGLMHYLLKKVSSRLYELIDVRLRESN